MNCIWATKSKDLGLIFRAVSFQDFQRVWSQSTNVTDGQIGGRTTCDRKTAIVNNMADIVSKCYNRRPTTYGNDLLSDRNTANTEVYVNNSSSTYSSKSAMAKTSGHSTPKSAMAMAIVAIPVAPPLQMDGLNSWRITPNYLVTSARLMTVNYLSIILCPVMFSVTLQSINHLFARWMQLHEHTKNSEPDS